jgi:hypothetical protein
MLQFSHIRQSAGHNVNGGEQFKDQSDRILYFNKLYALYGCFGNL